MNNTYSSLLARWLPCPLAALGLLLATAGAAQAQTPASFAPVATYTSGGSQPYGLAVGDVNGDGRPDLVTLNSTSYTVAVLLGSSTTPGTFGPPATYPSGGTTGAALSVALGDVNGDGRLDVVATNNSTNTVGVLLNSATTPGTFGSAAVYSTGSATGPRVVALGDVNGDGRLDIATAPFNAGLLSILLNSATTPGTFGAPANYSTGGSSTTSIALGDLNGDGRPDALALDQFTGNVAVFLNPAATPGTFGTPSLYSNGANSANSFGLTLGDLNGDGRPDVVTANLTSPTVSVLLNSVTAPGTLRAATVYSSGGLSPIEAAVNDVNGDGRADIAVSNFNSNQVGVLLGSTTTPGTFAAPVTFSTGAGSTPRGLVVADLNADGRRDIATANFGSGTVGVLLNTFVLAPTLTSISPNPAMAGTSVTLTGSNLTGATAVTFTGTSNNTVTTGLTVSGSGSNQTITVAVPTGANTGNVTVTTPGGTSNGVAFTVTPPAAPVAVEPANNSTTNSSPIFLVTATPGTYLTVYLNGPTPKTNLYFVSSNGFIRAQYSGLADGVYTLYATASAQSTGAPMSANSNTLTFTVDGTAPTATISTTSGSPTSTAPIPFSVSFSEPVTGLSASSFTVSNGTVTSGPTGSGSGPYTFSVTPTGNGTVSVSVAANAAQDAVGNGNTASNSVSVQYTAPVASGLSVQYQTGDLGQPTDNQLRPFLQLVNSGTTAVPYSSLTVRYWLTVENFMGQLVTPIDYAKLGTSFVSARYVALASPRQGAFGYIEYSFSAAAGNLNPGTDSGPIYGKAYKPDYTNFDETDDWSYQTSSSFTTNSHVTVYQNGTLVNGTEPSAVTAITALQVLNASRDASTSTQYLSVQLQVRNTGNLPVNYGDVKVRYYFTRDGATSVVPQVDYAKLGNGNISLRVVNLAAPVSGADAYLEVTFSAALGVFYPRTSTEDILLKLRKDTYQAFDQSNDYTFSGSTALTVNPRFPAYVSNALVFGTPPAGAPAIVAAPSQETSAKAGADEASIVAAAGASRELMLTGSPNPFGEQLHVRFALPTTQAYTLAVYDGQGRLVQQLASGQAEAGQAQELAVPTQGYAAGLYLVRLTTATGTQHLKLIKH